MVSMCEWSPYTEVPGLWMVETVDSFKAAEALDRRWGDRGLDCGSLRIMLQVNTSREESKSVVTHMLLHYRNFT